MKVHTTNYEQTFIAVADDCPVSTGEAPPMKGGKKTVATLQFEILAENPYKYTSDDVLFQVHAIRNEIRKADMQAAREEFFSKGQPCFRASPLTRRYGWGVHSDKDGRIAIYAQDTDDYRKLATDKTLTVVKAMRSKKL